MARRNLITQKEAAERYAVTARTIRNWISAGKITGYRLPGGRAIRVDAIEIDEIIAAIPTVGTVPGGVGQ